MYNSLALSTLTILGNYHHYLYTKVFYHPNHPEIFKLLLILSSDVSFRLSIPWLSFSYRLSYTTHSVITLFIPFSLWFIHLDICLPFSMCYFSSSLPNTRCNTREALRKMLLNGRLAGILLEREIEPWLTGSPPSITLILSLIFFCVLF